MSRQNIPRTKSSSTHGVKKSTTRQPAFTVYRDEPIQQVIAPGPVPVNVFKPGNAGRHSPTLFTKKGRESVSALMQSRKTRDLTLPTLPVMNSKRTVVDKKRKARRRLNPRIDGDDVELDMFDMEGASEVSSWGSAASSSSVMSTPPKRGSLVTMMSSSPCGPPTPDSPVLRAGLLPTFTNGGTYALRCPSPNMFSEG